MLTPPISPAWPIQLLNTRLSSYAYGPRHWLRRENKCLVKSRRDFVARSGLSLTTSSGAVPRISAAPALRGVAGSSSLAMAPAQGRCLVFSFCSLLPKGCSIRSTRSGEHLL